MALVSVKQMISPRFTNDVVTGAQTEGGLAQWTTTDGIAGLLAALTTSPAAAATMSCFKCREKKSAKNNSGFSDLQQTTDEDRRDESKFDEKQHGRKACYAKPSTTNATSKTEEGDGQHGVESSGENVKEQTVIEKEI